MYEPLRHPDAAQPQQTQQQPQEGHHRHHQQRQQPTSTAVHPTTAVIQPVQQVQFVVARQPRSPVEAYNNTQSMVAGIILIITGVLSIVFNVIAIYWFEIVSVVGHGIWCGIMVRTDRLAH